MMYIQLQKNSNNAEINMDSVKENQSFKNQSILHQLYKYL